MDKKTVKEMLKGAAEKDYIEIITKMTGRCHETEKIVIDWCKKNNKTHQQKAVEVELENLWGEAQAIISDFNEYGGISHLLSEADRKRHTKLINPMFLVGYQASGKESKRFPTRTVFDRYVQDRKEEQITCLWGGLLCSVLLNRFAEECFILWILQKCGLTIWSFSGIRCRFTAFW